MYKAVYDKQFDFSYFTAEQRCKNCTPVWRAVVLYDERGKMVVGGISLPVTCADQRESLLSDSERFTNKANKKKYNDECLLTIFNIAKHQNATGFMLTFYRDVGWDFSWYSRRSLLRNFYRHIHVFITLLLKRLVGTCFVLIWIYAQKKFNRLCWNLMKLYEY